MAKKRYVNRAEVVRLTERLAEKALRKLPKRKLMVKKYVNRADEAERAERYVNRMMKQRRIPARALKAKGRGGASSMAVASLPMTELAAKRLLNAPRGRGRPSRELQAKLERARQILGVRTGQRIAKPSKVSSKISIKAKNGRRMVTKTQLVGLVTKILGKLLSK